MSLWALLFIGLAIVMTIGPIMFIQPSRRDRYLADLRQQAAKSGLFVRLTEYSMNDGSNDTIAVYSLPVDLPLETQHWQLIKQSYSHEIHFHGQWEWQTASHLSTEQWISTEQQSLLKQLLNDLPSDVVGLECNRRNIGVWWQEKMPDTSINDIKGCLERCYAIILNKSVES